MSSAPPTVGGGAAGPLGRAPAAAIRYTPSREEFLALAPQHAVVPVWREVLADLVTPLAVYDRVRGIAAGTGDSGAAGVPASTFLLESVEHGERWGRYSFIGLSPFLQLTARGGQVRLDGDAPPAALEAAASGDPLATLDALLASLGAPDLDGLPPLFAGAIGYLGYDVVRFVERVPDTGADDLGLDDVRMVFPGQLLAFDHLRQRLLVISNIRTGAGSDADGAAYDRAVAAAEALVARLGEPVSAPPVAPPEAVDVHDAVGNVRREDYLDMVERAQSHIRAGDIFQVVPSQRFTLETGADPLTAYRVLRVINPSPYMYLFEWDDLQIVGSSPEALVTVEDGAAQIWPIAGSRPRGATPDDDAALEASLLADEKERAEHTMLVDLARNDLGRVCELGTVRVSEFMGVVRYSHVMHLVSTVAGRLRAGVSAVDVLRATFPAGTLSGAPKVRAMEIIDDLEPTRRGPYGGGIGYLDLAGNLDLCITIRTVLFRHGRAHVQAGAGVVADSVPDSEYEETRNKAMALLAAVRAAERMDAAGGTAAGGARASGA